jgi:cell division protein FtsB
MQEEVRQSKVPEDESLKPPRRQDLLDLGGTFRESLSPLREILDHMRGLNVRYAASNRQLRAVTRFQVVISLLSIVSLSFLVVIIISLWHALDVLQSHTTALHALEEEVVSQAKNLTQIRDTAKKTEARVAEVREEQDQKPTLELIPETDPVKARRAPVKLRVKAPMHPKSAASASAGVASKSVPPSVAEIPLTTGSF